MFWFLEIFDFWKGNLGLCGFGGKGYFGFEKGREVDYKENVIFWFFSRKVEVFFVV